MAENDPLGPPLKPEYILCAAIRYPDFFKTDENGKETKDIILCGRRHADCIHNYFRLTGFKTSRRHPQGFMTSHGRFVGRVEAVGIAFNAGQIKETYDQLISEHLY